AYCQDNETSWYDWERASLHGDILAFCSALIRFRMKHPVFRRPEFYTGRDTDDNQLPDITWFDESGRPPHWASINLTLAALIDGSPAENSAIGDDDFYLMFNASAHSIAFTVPRHPRDLLWHKVIDTSAPLPTDSILNFVSQPLQRQESCTLGARSLVVLLTVRQ
ncbi:MAG: glycogen debranching enzyme, partial [Spirochaetae bacterium HGW-Spirochaetae-9]